VFELDGWRLTTRSVAGPVRPELIVAEDHRRENQHRDEQQD
jgi:ribosomal protein S28E/S33